MSIDSVPDVLLIQERVQGQLALGESQFREFKSAWEGRPGAKRSRDPKAVAKDIGETLVAFANADGGVLLIGVEDDGTVTGLSYDDNGLEVLTRAPLNNVHASTPLPTPVVRQLTIGQNLIFYFSVEKSTRLVHQTSDGKCLQRKDLQNLPVAFEQLQFERQEQLSREYDQVFVDGATPLDLDLELVRRVSDHMTRGISPEKCLQFLGLADYSSNLLQLRRAALLLFAKDIARWHPRCEVRLLRVKGAELKTGRDYNAISDETSTGNILQLLSSAWERLRPHLVETKLAPDALFKERVIYPEDVCREALTNAIAHRNYGIEGRGIEILIFDDRMEVHSPGGLLSTVRVEELKKLQGVHQSRNPLVARTLREIGYMREMGEGLRRIFKLMSDADLVSPELRSDASKFAIVLSHKSVFSDADQRWLDGFRPLRLTREEMLVALSGRDGQLVSAQKIYDILGLVDWDVYRMIVDQMQAKGVLYNTSPKTQRRPRTTQKRRDVPRLAIRSPGEIEKGLAELFAACGRIPATAHIAPEALRAVTTYLPRGSIYRFSMPQMEKVLRVLGLIDENRRPTEILSGIWRATRSPHETPGSANTPKGGIAQPSLDAARPLPAKRTLPPPHSKGSATQSRVLFVGNVDYGATKEELQHVFEQCGELASVEVPVDYATQRGRGFAFVRMKTDREAAVAIQQLSGKLLLGRALRINWSEPRPAQRLLGRAGPTRN